VLHALGVSPNPEPGPESKIERDYKLLSDQTKEFSPKHASIEDGRRTMSQWLPYLFLGLLFWEFRDGGFGMPSSIGVRQKFLHATSLGHEKHRFAARPWREDFGPQDWDFVLRETPSEIQRVFQRERTFLALAWLRRTRVRTSQAVYAHVAVARHSEDLQIVMEIKLALSYVLFLILCNSLIGWVWFRGPVRARKIVSQTFSGWRGSAPRLGVSWQS